MYRSNLTNKYNPQELIIDFPLLYLGSNLTNKYNPQELDKRPNSRYNGSNLTNKYNPQEQTLGNISPSYVQILPINTILKNKLLSVCNLCIVQILPINTILKNRHCKEAYPTKFKSYQ